MTSTGKNQKRIQCFAFVIAAALALSLAALAVNKNNSAPAQAAVVNHELINPNHADLVSLTRLPNIGPSRAQAIITFRQAFYRKTDNDQAFKEPSDLREVKSIGPKTVEAITPYIEFD